MTILVAIVVLAVTLGIDMAASRAFPDLHRFADPMMLPLIWYALRRSQRAAMLVGCAGGLVQDAWFGGSLFGSAGFSKTLLGFLLGGLAARFELNIKAGRFLSGAILPIADPFVEMGIRSLFGIPVAPVDPVGLSVRGLVGGLLTLLVFAIVDRVTGERGRRRPATRRV